MFLSFIQTLYRATCLLGTESIDRSAPAPRTLSSKEQTERHPSAAMMKTVVVVAVSMVMLLRISPNCVAAQSQCLNASLDFLYSASLPTAGYNLSGSFDGVSLTEYVILDHSAWNESEYEEICLGLGGAFYEHNVHYNCTPPVVTAVSPRLNEQDNFLPICLGPSCQGIAIEMVDFYLAANFISPELFCAWNVTALTSPTITTETGEIHPTATSDDDDDETPPTEPVPPPSQCVNETLALENGGFLPARDYTLSGSFEPFSTFDTVTVDYSTWNESEYIALCLDNGGSFYQYSSIIQCAMSMDGVGSEGFEEIENGVPICVGRSCQGDASEIGEFLLADSMLPAEYHCKWNVTVFSPKSTASGETHPAEASEDDDTSNSTATMKPADDDSTKTTSEISTPPSETPTTAPSSDSNTILCNFCSVARMMNVIPWMLTGLWAL